MQLDTSSVRFVCVAPDHTPRLMRPDFGLTVHLREWAFCPAGEHYGHDWRPVEDGGFDELVTHGSGDALSVGD